MKIALVTTNKRAHYRQFDRLNSSFGTALKLGCRVSPNCLGEHMSHYLR
jgi:hypothetical protein